METSFLLFIAAMAAFRSYICHPLPHQDDLDQCILLIGGLPNGPNVEYYHPEDGVDCDREAVGEMSLRRVDQTDWTGGCYLADSRLVVTRESDNPFKPPMLYDLNDGSDNELELPFRASDGRTRYTPYNVAAPIGSSKCMSCGGAYFEGGWKRLTECYQFDSAQAARGWTKLSVDSPHRMALSAAVVLADNDFFLVGGYDGESMKQVYRYQIKEQRWSSDETSMSRPRHWHSAAALSATELLTCGGTPKRRDCEVYSTVFKKWRPVGDLRVGREQFAMVDFNGDIYALGGDGPSEKLATVERFDRRTERWVAVKPLERARSHFVAVGIRIDPNQPQATLSPFEGDPDEPQATLSPFKK